MINFLYNFAPILFILYGIGFCWAAVRVFSPAAQQLSTQKIALWFIVITTGIFIVAATDGIAPQNIRPAARLVPLNSFRGDINPRQPLEIIGNVFLFSPLGFFWKPGTKDQNITFGFLYALGVSCSAEIYQYYANMGRSADIDDVILNLVGHSIGTLSYLTLATITNRSQRI